ncbi:hypothetical protein [Acidovorax sp. SUPP3334]|uniref:hypothetical protein n=1 Tax=Acidovorax sp. SUPP3334 TaxID=2920881 RepID=UPI0023DE44A8|nr:hypothetical protein [Acidovorax sp. SUPP3334]GKT25752.1 type III secretion protein [Acidovorax sp. SUPP3334]
MGNRISGPRNTPHHGASTASPADSVPSAPQGASSRQPAARADAPPARTNVPAAVHLPAPRVVLGTSPGALRWGGDAPLETHEVQQAAYLLGEQVAGEAITSPRRWAAAGQTVHDVRVLLEHGRGNVQADDAPSGGHNGIGSSVTSHEYDDGRRLAVAAVMGAAVCDEHAGLASILHAPHMAPGEQTTTVSARVTLRKPKDQGGERVPDSIHSWAELLRGQDGDPSKKAAILMDPWANGPAVRPRHSAWKNASVAVHATYTGSQAAEAKQLVERLIPGAHPEMDADSDDEENVGPMLAKKRLQPTAWEKYAEAQVVSRTFAREVRDKLAGLPPQEQERMASRIVQEAYGLAPGSAAHHDAVQSVLETARHLHKLPRPAVTPWAD